MDTEENGFLLDIYWTASDKITKFVEKQFTSYTLSRIIHAYVNLLIFAKYDTLWIKSISK